jgi:hypothetical protein
MIKLNGGLLRHVILSSSPTNKKYVLTISDSFPYRRVRWLRVADSSYIYVCNVKCVHNSCKSPKSRHFVKKK